MTANSHRETLDHYSRLAKVGGESVRGPADLEALREFTKRLRPGAPVLDAGCGAGRDLKFFRELGLLAEGFDGSLEMTKLAAAHSGASVWQADFLALSLRGRGPYSGIWAHRSLIHVPPTACQKVMGEFFGALEPQGLLFVSIDEGQTTSSDTPPQAVREPGPEDESRAWIYRYPAASFASLLRQSGFSILAQGRNLAAPDQVGFLARRL